MLEYHVIVADGDTGWEVQLYAHPGWAGDYIVLADGLSEEDADTFAKEYIARFGQFPVRNSLVLSCLERVKQIIASARGVLA